jgi:hypothetical protein
VWRLASMAKGNCKVAQDVPSTEVFVRGRGGGAEGEDVSCMPPQLGAWHSVAAASVQLLLRGPSRVLQEVPADTRLCAQQVGPPKPG